MLTYVSRLSFVLLEAYWFSQEIIFKDARFPISFIFMIMQFATTTTFPFENNFLNCCTSLSFSSAHPGNVKALFDAAELFPSLSSSVGEFVSGLGDDRMLSSDEASIRYRRTVKL